MKKDYFLGLSPEGFHKIAYLEWGTTDPRPPIICVHGLTRLNHDFDSLATYLSVRGRHLFCPDIVGRGDSDWLSNPQHYTYEQYIADMNALIARTGAKQVDWIGTSMGGLIGMMMAAQPNTPIRRLVLNDIGPQITTKAIARLSQYAGLDPDFPSLDAAKSHYKTIYADFGDLSEAQWDYLVSMSVREIAPGKFASKLDPGVKVTPAKSAIAWKLLLNPQKALEGTLFDIDLWSIWRKITCPVLVIHGERSDLLTPTIIQKMQQTHPLTELLTIKNTGHAPALLNEQEHSAIQQFLE